MGLTVYFNMSAQDATQVYLHSLIASIKIYSNFCNVLQKEPLPVHPDLNLWIGLRRLIFVLGLMFLTGDVTGVKVEVILLRKALCWR